MQCLANLAETLAWLCCDPLEAIELKNGVTVKVGRHKDCDLFIPHKALSRVHVIVTVADGVISFEDRSSNGLSVNGRRVKTGTLGVGDILTLGPYDIELRRENIPDEDDLGGSTMELDYASRLTGRLKIEPLIQTLQGLEFNEKTGVLEVLSGHSRGKLVVRSGRPVCADLGELVDEEAVMAMLNLKDGSFSFVPVPDPAGEERMDVSFTRLLLDHSRIIDEDTVD